MRIQYASDLHLELWPKTTFEETLRPEADYLVLCGDVSTPDHPNYRKFLEFVSENWELVFYIPGLCEMKQSYELFLNRCSTFKNIHVLYKNSFLLREEDETLLIVGVPLMTRKHNELFDEHRQYLERVIKTSQYPILVCSYYAPFTWMYDEDSVKNPSETIAEHDLEKLIVKPVLAWIVGHIHLSIEYIRRYFLTTGEDGSVLFVSNPRGKILESEGKLYPQNRYYRKEAVIRLNPSALEEYSPDKSSQIPLWHRRNLELGRR